MSDMKIEILKKLENGEISAQDALGMLNQQPPEEHREAFHESRRDDRYDDRQQGNFLGGVFGWVGELVDDISDGIKDMDIGNNVSDFMEGVYAHYKGKESFSVDVSQDVAGLTLVGKNAKLEVRGHDGNSIRVECYYDSRRPEPEIYLHEENGRFKLVYNEEIMRSFRIVCEVPRRCLNEALFATKNDKVSVSGVVAGKLMVSTKNGNVRMEEVSARELIVQGRNDSIKVKRVEASNIHFETTNAGIAAETLSGDTVCFKTSNASIKTIDCRANHMRLLTSNAGLRVVVDESDVWSGERTIEAVTSNGGIALYVSNDVGLRIDARTTSAKISCDRDNLSFSDFSKNRAVGESLSYGSMSKKVAVRLSTTNGGIKIREG